MTKEKRVIPLPRAGKTKRGCPTCGRPSTTKFRPFCSQRCADLDLGRWLKGQYRIPTTEAPGETPEEDDEG